MEWLVIAWAGIIGFCVLMYVILDGFTLGTGIMLCFLNKQEKDLSLSVILTTWDGNQTWLVLGLAALYGAFPSAFSFLLPVLYLPLLLMAIFLLFRGVIFEFRLKATGGQIYWDFLFIASSLWVAVIQGLVFGNVLEGFNSPHAFFSFFSCLCGIAVPCAYSLLGAARLVLKTSGPLQNKMEKRAFWLSLGILFLLIILSFWFANIHPEAWELWHEASYVPFLIGLPLLGCLGFMALWIGIFKHLDKLPYWGAVLVIFACYAGAGLALYPYAVPYQMDIFTAASEPNTLLFIFVGAAIMLPILLLYTGYSYWIFRGKVKEVIHY